MDEPAPVRIVFMDDDPSVQMLVRTMLTRAGYQVRVAGNGLEGMKLLEEEPAELVITDLVMPEQEGLESIMKLRQLYPDIKIIAVSGGLQNGLIDMLPMANKLGARRTLRKPIMRQELLQAVAEVLAE